MLHRHLRAIHRNGSCGQGGDPPNPDTARSATQTSIGPRSATTAMMAPRLGSLPESNEDREAKPDSLRVRHQTLRPQTPKAGRTRHNTREQPPTKAAGGPCIPGWGAAVHCQWEGRFTVWNHHR
uniref:Fusion glycoprotein F0 n=1 Tax=Lygus hesperus TaxID=30085 RepID=A0A0A9ZB66_LYGHE